jgi:hypothetical protein
LAAHLQPAAAREERLDTLPQLGRRVQLRTVRLDDEHDLIERLVQQGCAEDVASAQAGKQPV